MPSFALEGDAAFQSNILRAIAWIFGEAYVKSVLHLRHFCPQYFFLFAKVLQEFHCPSFASLNNSSGVQIIGV